MKLSQLLNFACVMLVVGLTGTALCQSPGSYLNDTGSTSYGVNIPVENGFINVSNGNLHLEFPLASHPQRGALTLSERLEYDSRIWMFSPFGSNGSYHWWPTNVPGTTGSSGGWKFVTGAEIGTVNIAPMGTTQRGCYAPHDPNDDDRPQPTPGQPPTRTPYDWYEVTTTSSITWVEPSGSSHPFNASLVSVTNHCDGSDDTQVLTGGYATDGSGYQTPNTPNSTAISIIDGNGTQVYPSIIDRYGNYWSQDGQGNLIDDTGRTPVIATQAGNVTYYDVLVPGGQGAGPRARYTVTTAPVSVATSFIPYSSSDIHDWNSPNLLTPVQSIVLPDGSKYSFTYDNNGELQTVQLPTGGSIFYGYTDFVDSANTENNWLATRIVGGTMRTTITPHIEDVCTNYANGCREYVTLHKRQLHRQALDHQSPRVECYWLFL